MIITIKDYEKIRKMYAVEKLSVREISRITGFSRNTVAKYCKGDTIPEGNRVRPAGWIGLSDGSLF